VRLARAGDGLGSGGRCRAGSVKLGRQRGGRHGASGAGAGPTMGQTALGQAGDEEAGAGRAGNGAGSVGSSRRLGGWREAGDTRVRRVAWGQAGDWDDGDGLRAERRQSDDTENRADDALLGGARSQADGNSTQR
jgi:hypothetical protein